MKKIHQCLVCGDYVPRSLAYEASVEKEISNPMTGEIVKTTVRGVICPLCNEKLGYSTSRKKIEKYEGCKKD